MLEYFDVTCTEIFNWKLGQRIGRCMNNKAKPSPVTSVQLEAAKTESILQLTKMPMFPAVEYFDRDIVGELKK